MPYLTEIIPKPSLCCRRKHHIVTLIYFEEISEGHLYDSQGAQDKLIPSAKVLNAYHLDF